VKARHEDIGGLWLAAGKFGSDRHHLAEPWSNGQVLGRLTLYFTGMAADAVFRVLEKIIFAHIVSLCFECRNYAVRARALSTVQPLSMGVQKVHALAGPPDLFNFNEGFMKRRASADRIGHVPFKVRIGDPAVIRPAGPRHPVAEAVDQKRGIPVDEVADKGLQFAFALIGENPYPVPVGNA